MIAVSIIGLVYFAQKFSFKDKPILFISGFLLLVTSIYSWTKGKKQQNDVDPVLVFKEKGLLLNDSLYQWDKIKNWIYKGGGKDSNGEMVFAYQSMNGDEEQVKVDLNKVNIDRIDFMLLLTHFKAKYG